MNRVSVVMIAYLHDHTVAVIVRQDLSNGPLFNRVLNTNNTHRSHSHVPLHPFSSVCWAMVRHRGNFLCLVDPWGWTQVWLQHITGGVESPKLIGQLNQRQYLLKVIFRSERAPV